MALINDAPDPRKLYDDAEKAYTDFQSRPGSQAEYNDAQVGQMDQARTAAQTTQLPDGKWINYVADDGLGRDPDQKTLGVAKQYGLTWDAKNRGWVGDNPQVFPQAREDMSKAVYTGPGNAFDIQAFGAVLGPLFAAVAAPAVAGWLGISDMAGGALVKGAIGAATSAASGGNPITGAALGAGGSVASGLINGADIGGSVDEFGNPTGQYAVGSDGNTPASSVDVADMTGGTPNAGAQNLVTGSAGSETLQGGAGNDTGSFAQQFLDQSDAADMARGAQYQASDPAKFAELQGTNTFGAPGVNLNAGGAKTGTEVVNDGDQAQTGAAKDVADSLKKVTEAEGNGTLDKMLEWARKNPALVTMGGGLLAGLAKGLMDHSNIQLKSELDVKTKAELLDLYRRNVQAGTSGGANVNIGVAPSGKQLTRISTGGLINGAR